MKKALWIVMAAALAVAVVAASAQTEVLSANAVGYIKKTLPAGGKLETFTVPLYPMDSGLTYFTNTSIAVDAPIGTTVYFWDPTFNAGLGGWDTVTRGTFSGWGKFATKELAAGEGFFMKSPVDSTEDIELTITGEVPDEALQNTAIRPNLNLAMVGNPYPVDVVFGDTELAVNAAVGSIASFWDTELGDSGNWVIVTKGLFSGWGSAETRMIEAGEAFAFREQGTRETWAVDRPYTWPAE